MAAELIKITETNGKQAVSARELYKFLGATERFSVWFERQMQYGFVENVDYIGCKEFNTLANQELTDYALTLEIAEITGKQHAHVMRDIRVLLDQGVTESNFGLSEYKDVTGRTLPCYNLTKKGCLILASGYDALLREKTLNLN